MTSDDRPRIRRRAALGLVSYSLLLVAVLVLPISYAGLVNTITEWLHESLALTAIRSGWVEFGANILVFVPLGLLVTLLARHPLHGVGLALLLSVTAELAQLVIPSRQPSLRDILANVTGGAVGAALAWFLLRRVRRRSQRRR